MASGLGIANNFTPSHVHTEGQYIAKKLGCRFVETSAKLGSNVTETFIDLVCEIRDRNRVSFFFFFSGALLRLSFIFIMWHGSSDLTKILNFAFFIFPSRLSRD